MYTAGEERLTLIAMLINQRPDLRLQASSGRYISERRTLTLETLTPWFVSLLVNNVSLLAAAMLKQCVLVSGRSQKQSAEVEGSFPGTQA